MIIYQSTKGGFLDDILGNNIHELIHNEYKKAKYSGVSEREVRSWQNSLQYVNNVLLDPEIPETCGVAIEYNIPQTGKRIDFILSGKGDNNASYAIIIELKQWEKAELSEKDGVVKTFVAKGNREVSHPSYQAWSYAALLEGFNEAVYSKRIQLKPCVYLHNYLDDGVITHQSYSDYISKAPLFLRADALKLRAFIKQFIRYGDNGDVLYEIESGNIKPSKALADVLLSMLKGNDEFIMIDEQKLVYEQAIALSKQSNSKNKNVLIVKGGPGTGKSVVAVNLLVNTTKLGLLAQYVTKNAAPRAVYQDKLTQDYSKSYIQAMFKGSGGYMNVNMNVFDALIVDEAHRLNEKSGLYGNQGENQIKEIINAAKCSIFFIDEDQKVTLKDIGTKDEIIKWANTLGASITEMELESQFRCNGSDGYLAWLDNTLGIRETVNKSLEGINYDFKVYDSPVELRDKITELNRVNNKARMVAGYCWDWNSRKNTDLYDVIIPEYDFKMKWNLTKDGSLWIISPESVNEIGCIHTCQGLEVDYIGVVIGDDFIIRNGKATTQPSERSKHDNSIKGYKKLQKENPALAFEKTDAIIKNTYRTLMTRGMKGCYIYCTDKETAEYFKSCI